MLVAVIVRVMPIIPLSGRGRADISFDDFHTVLAEVVQRPVLVVSEQPHHPVGALLAGGIDKEEGTACPGVAQPALSARWSTTISLIALARMERSCCRRAAMRSVSSPSYSRRSPSGTPRSRRLR